MNSKSKGGELLRFYMKEILEDKPIVQILEDKPFVTDRSPIKDSAHRSAATPFISVDPVTGKRKEVATAQVVSHHE